MQSDFPHTPDAVEPKWLTATLQNHGTLTPDQQVVAVQQTPIGDIVGVVGEVARFELTYAPSNAGPASLVIKFAHRNPENRAIANNTKMYEREVIFFNEIASQVQTPHTSIPIQHTSMRVCVPGGEGRRSHRAHPRRSESAGLFAIYCTYKIYPNRDNK